MRTVDLLPAVRAADFFAVPFRADEPADPERAEVDPRAGARPVVVPEREPDRLPVRESVRGVAEVFPAMRSRYPLQSL